MGERIRNEPARQAGAGRHARRDANMADITEVDYIWKNGEMIPIRIRRFAIVIR